MPRSSITYSNTRRSSSTARRPPRSARPGHLRKTTQEGRKPTAAADEKEAVDSGDNDSHHGYACDAREKLFSAVSAVSPVDSLG